MANQPARGPPMPDPKGCAIHVQSGLMGDISAGIRCPLVHRGPVEEGTSSRALWQLGKPSFNVPLAQHRGPAPWAESPRRAGGRPGWGLRVQGAAPSPGTQAAGHRPGLVCGAGQARIVPWVWAFPCETGLLSLETASASYHPGLALGTAVTHEVTPVALLHLGCPGSAWVWS